jgi:hypothetical protein
MRAIKLDPHYEIPIMPSDRKMSCVDFRNIFALPRRSATVKANKHNSLGDKRSRCMATQEAMP